MKNKESNIHADHRARMKQIFLKHGFSSFSEIEKVEFILYYGIPFKDTNPIAHKLLDEFKNIKGIIEAPIKALTKIEGVGEHVAILLKVLLCVIDEYHQNIANSNVNIKGVNSACRFCQNLFVSKQREELIIICIDNNGNVSNYKTISKGSASEVQIEIRDITEFIINTNADRIIITHNHPTGSPSPSDDDFSFTSKVIMALMCNNVEILDHIIVSPYGTYSMKKENVLSPLVDQVLKVYNISPVVPKSTWTDYSLDD